jgi:pimeloyl-ACP methyl ester carboxylesterase
MANSYVDAVTKTVDVNGTSFVYRETGEKNGIPVVLLHHLTAVLDDWDPRTIDSLAQKHRVIAFNNRGVGGSKGTTPDTIFAFKGGYLECLRQQAGVASTSKLSVPRYFAHRWQ